VRTPFCLCPQIEPIQTRIELVVIRHPLEAWKTTNTARLAALALPRLRIIPYEGPEGEANGERWLAKDAVLLFPEAPAEPEGADSGAAPRSRPLPAAPTQLVVLDGTWRQVRKMARRLTALSALPRLQLTPAPAKVVRLREPPTENALSTLEAIALGLKELGEEDACPRLLQLHSLMVERVLTARGLGSRVVP
jgi:DTW domain-containing protein YfiP